MICSSARPIVIPRETKFLYFNKIYGHSQFHVRTNSWKPKCLPKDSNPLISSSSASERMAAVEPLTSGASGRINALFSLRALRSLLLLLNAAVLFLLLPFRGQRRASAICSGDKVGKEEKQDCRRKGSSSSSAVVRVPAAMVLRRSAAMILDQEAAARRSLAIQRVVEDDDNSTVREFSLFTSARGEALFTQSWTPVSVVVRSVFD